MRYQVSLIAVTIFAAMQLGAADPGLATRDPRYQIQPTDRLGIQYRYTPEYDQTVEVQPDGFVSLSIAGDLKLAGSTLDQARTAILERVSTRLNAPEITVTLEEYVKPSYVVAGQVASPGKFELHGNITAVEAIAIAGGFKDSSAKHSQVILFRRISPGMAETKILNLKRLMNPAHPHLEESVLLQPGDLLVIPQNTVSKLERYIHWANVGAFLPLPTP